MQESVRKSNDGNGVKQFFYCFYHVNEVTRV